jgi:hypothetical protein
MISSTIISRLILLFMPVFVFHPDETIFPMRISDYTKMCILTSTTYKLRPEYENYFKLGTQPIYLDSLSNAPVYVKTKVQSDFLYITYILFYPYNEDYNISGLIHAGGHDADIEHVTIKICANNCNTKYTIDKMYYSAHSTGEGLWTNDIERKRLNPIVYVAKGSHGMYNKKGYYFRYYGFANDITDSGIYWKPGTVIHVNTLPSDNLILTYKGLYGNGNVASLTLRGWWDNPLSETDNNSPFYNSNINIRIDLFIPLIIIILIFMVCYKL